MIQREKSGFPEVFRDHLDFVVRVVSRLTHPQNSDLDDLVQEVMIVAFRKWSKFDHQCRVSTWLYGITWRVVAAWCRKNKHRILSQHFDEQSDPRDSQSPHDAMEVAEQIRRVYFVLDSMNEKKREVLVLFEIQGFKGNEIAELLGCKQSTVYTRLLKARREFLRRWHKKFSRETVGIVRAAGVKEEERE